MTSWKKLALLGVAVPMLGFIGGGSAEACIALGTPKITLKLEKDGTGKALISEYDCSGMIQKTNCIVGLRLSDSALSDAKIAVSQLRFVDLRDGSPVKGFVPTPNSKTTAAWGRVMDGTWYGFSAVFGAQTDRKGGLAIEVSFSYNPSMTPQQIAQAFNFGHVGLAEGDTQGGIARGHMLEVTQIQGANLASL